jgi:hypothetical protein
VIGRELAPDAALFEADALIWDRLPQPLLTYGAPGGASLDIAFPDTPMLGIWQKPVRNSLYRTLAWHSPIPSAIRRFPRQAGVITLPPGAERSFRMDVYRPARANRAPMSPTAALSPSSRIRRGQDHADREAAAAGGAIHLAGEVKARGQAGARARTG